MVAFLTLFLGLVYGPVNVELSVGADVSRIELLVDGERAAEIGPPWVGNVVFGPEIAPHELVAVARDARGNRLGEARQWVNRAKPFAEAGIVLERDRAGRATAARLVWRCPASPAPRSFSVLFDGRPIEVTDPARIPLPPHETNVAHLLLADVTFDGGVVATAVAGIGGANRGDSSRELTAFPVRLAGKGRLPPPERLDGWFEAGGRSLNVAAVEEGPAEVVFVMSGAVRFELRRLAAEDYWPWPWGRPRPIAFKHATRYRFMVATPQTLTGEGTLTTRIFPTSEDYTPPDGPFLKLASDAFLDDVPTPPRVAEAVAVSGLSATRRERRRAVVLLLGPGGMESSDFDPARARRYLSRLRVPFQVWRLCADGFPVAPGWPDAVDASTAEGLRRAFGELRADLASQRIVWLEGRLDPSTVEVGARAVGVVTAR